MAAQQPPAAQFVGRPVGSVTLSIEGQPTQEVSLRDAIQTKAGAPLSMTEVRESIGHLYAFGRFEDVQVMAESTPDGRVTLRYELAPIHVVTAVEFRGELGLSESALRKRMTDRFGALPPLSRQNDVAAALRDLYRESGYFNATVAPRPPIVEHVPHRATAVFEVHAGAQAKIAKSNVLGHPLEPVDKVRARLLIVPGQPYEPGELQRRLTEYVGWMRHQRHYEASAHDEPPSLNADRTSVDVTVNVEPGPLVRVRFEGDPLPGGKKIEDLVPIEREGSVDPDLLEDSARRIKDALNEQGYWKADVKTPEQREQNGELVLVFHITRGAQYRVAPGGIQFRGNTAVPVEEIQAALKDNKVALPRQGDLFVESRLGAIQNNVKLLYRRRGYVQADVSLATEDAGPGLARPVITVKEGTRVVVGRVAIAGNQHIPTATLMKDVTIATGAPYFGTTIGASRDAIAEQYLNEGYDAVSVTVSPLEPKPTSPGNASSDVTFTVQEGPQTIVDQVFVTGNLLTKPDVILRELQFHPGGPLGQAAVAESRSRLSALGLFRRIQIQSVPHGDTPESDVVVTVEEAPRTTIAYGGGLQVDQIQRDNGDGTTSQRYELGPRGFFEVGRRNLRGTNRSIDLYTRLSLRPSTTSADNSRFAEYRIVGTYREPRAVGNYGDLTGTAAVEQGVRTGFNFYREGLNAEFTRLFGPRVSVPNRFAPRIRGSLRYSFGQTRIMDLEPSLINATQTEIDRAFPQVRLSAFAVAASRDTRDDLLEPQRGSLVSVEGTAAARAIGSEVGYTKMFLQGFFYRNLGKPRLVFAGGVRLGVADPFSRPCTDPDGNLTTCRELPASERFFAGGSTTIRGYAVDTVGVPLTITPTGVPIGGDSTIVLNAELRTPLLGPVGGVLFVDGGNVYPRTTDLDLGDLRGSVGTGVRVRSPIGPIRLDIGLKLDRRVIGGKREAGYAIHFSIGQAF